jgi:predicted DNA-binding transcriptional regulator AlpA
MPDIEEDRLITTSEPARLLGCHAVTVYKKLKVETDFPRPVRGVCHRLKWWLRRGTYLHQ